MSVGTALIYIAALLLVSFVVSGVVPRYRAAVARRGRVGEFERKYTAWVEANNRLPDEDYYGGLPLSAEESAGIDAAAQEAQELRPWLVARRDQMQRDADTVGRGVMYIAPPPMIGGSYKAHPYFADLFDTQTESVGSTSFRVDELASIAFETGEQVRRWKRDTYNPWAWVRLAFERIVAFPRYVLRHAGFSAQVTDSTAARLVSVVWSVVVGATGIGGFVLVLLEPR